MTKILTREEAKKLEPYFISPIGDWVYKDDEGFMRLFRGGKELTEGIEAICCWTFNDGWWGHKTKEGIIYEKQDSKNPTKTIN